MQIGLNDISYFYFLFPCSELSIEIMLLPSGDGMIYLTA